MNDIELNDDKLLEKFDKKVLEFIEGKLVNVKYFYSFPMSSEKYIIFDVQHKDIIINTSINNIETLKCIMEIGKELDILKVEKEEEK